MELPSSRFSSRQPLDTPTTNESSSTMSTLTLRAPSSLLPSPRDAMWEDRPAMSMPSRPRSENERIELPSIRQAIPELDMASTPIDKERRESSTNSPTRGSAPAESSYVSSPSLMNKRRRFSEEAESIEPRDYSVPRIYRSPRQSVRGINVTHSPSGRRLSQYSTPDYANRVSPYPPSRGLPSIRTSPSFESAPRNDFRPTLPSLPSLTLDRGPPAPAPRTRNWSDYALETARPSAQTYSPQASAPASAFDPPTPHSGYPPSGYGLGYQPPQRGQYSGSGGLHHPMERSPFSGPAYHHGPHDGQMYDMGMGGMSEGSKQRKRRGNLPKETTDKLRAWFVAHLQHPYPTEDEKQDLMRQTGLQMNQISNWFINARRRQLPAMINSARAENDARSQRSSGDGSGNPNSVLLGPEDNSGSEGGFDDDYEGLTTTGGRPQGMPASASTPATPSSATAQPMSVAALTMAKQQEPS